MPYSNDMKRASRSVSSTHSQKEITLRSVTSNDEVILEAHLERDGRGGYMWPRDSCFKGSASAALLARRASEEEGRKMPGA